MNKNLAVFVPAGRATVFEQNTKPSLEEMQKYVGEM